jgi:hypothetical protein
MAQDHGTLGEHIVDIGMTVYIIEVDAMRTTEKEGRAFTLAAHIAVDPTGDYGLGACKELVRAWPD